MPLTNVGLREWHGYVRASVSKTLVSLILFSMLAVSTPAAPRGLADATKVLTR